MRNQPLDEVAIKRRGVEGHVLISDNDHKIYRTFFEAYHDENEILNLEKIAVNKETGEANYESELYLTLSDAKLLIKTVQDFIDKCEK
ncbi:hypothetical protein [Paenibacillus glacialis]|uniref:Uncharacterized protein n=1 Tax=Paenibacillus glacialis TaxID=494026 RepID=A0A162K682_9BACL|nr:hypothetical protein [Paenibacillus glacialis]OAB41308.1 hypothetical protein PGLA_15990 [Paenibacillus glacialis]